MPRNWLVALLLCSTLVATGCSKVEGWFVGGDEETQDTEVSASQAESSEETKKPGLFKRAAAGVVKEILNSKDDEDSPGNEEKKNGSEKVATLTAEISLSSPWDRLKSSKPDFSTPGEAREVLAEASGLNKILNSLKSMFSFRWSNYWFWVIILVGNILVVVFSNGRNTRQGIAMGAWIFCHLALVAANWDKLPITPALRLALFAGVPMLSLGIGLCWTGKFRFHFYQRWYMAVTRDAVDKFMISKGLEHDDGTIPGQIPENQQEEWQKHWEKPRKKLGLTPKPPRWQQKKLLLTNSVLFWWCSMLSVFWNEVLYDVVIRALRHWFSKDMDEATAKAQAELRELTGGK